MMTNKLARPAMAIPLLRLAQKKAARSSRKRHRKALPSQVFGEITWLMSQSPLHKNLFLSDLEWKVMVPVMPQQFRLFYDQQKPVDVVFWAFVNGEVAQRLASDDKRLRPQDWKSGDRREVVEIVAPFGGEAEMLKDLNEKVFRR